MQHQKQFCSLASHKNFGQSYGNRLNAWTAGGHDRHSACRQSFWRGEVWQFAGCCWLMKWQAKYTPVQMQCSGMQVLGMLSLALHSLLLLVWHKAWAPKTVTSPAKLQVLVPWLDEDVHDMESVLKQVVAAAEHARKDSRQLLSSGEWLSTCLLRH